VSISAALRRWRGVLPLEAGMGQAPQSLASAASERMRPGLSPTRMSISAAVPAPMPWACTRSGASCWVSCSRLVSWPLISRREPANAGRWLAGWPWRKPWSR
jgi:hypothetical protein